TWTVPCPWSCARATLAIPKAPTASARRVRVIAGLHLRASRVAVHLRSIVRPKEAGAFPAEQPDALSLPFPFQSAYVSLRELGNAKATEVAATPDRKLGQLVAGAIN